MISSKPQDKNKQLLFSLTRDDFKWDYFRAGGKGGQNQNAVNSGVRCTHPPSGAVGEGRDSRDQLANRRSAFVRCLATEKFKTWHRQEVTRRLTGTQPRTLEDVEREIDAMMQPENLKVEEYDPNGK